MHEAGSVSCLELQRLRGLEHRSIDRAEDAPHFPLCSLLGLSWGLRNSISQHKPNEIVFISQGSESYFISDMNWGPDPQAELTKMLLWWEGGSWLRLPTAVDVEWHSSVLAFQAPHNASVLLFKDRTPAKNIKKPLPPHWILSLWGQYEEKSNRAKNAVKRFPRTI